MSSSSEQSRRKDTGEPGNGGKFAGHDHDDADVTLHDSPHPDLKGRAAEIAAARAADERIAAKWDEFWEVENPLRAVRMEVSSVRKRLARATVRGWTTDSYTRQLTELNARIEELAPIAQERASAARELDADLYTGWSRFFLVEHIHNTARCSSFRLTTRVGWLPKVSGLTEAEAVAEYGATLCTKCFPEAPVQLTRQVADPSICPGSGQPNDSEHLTGRERAYYSPTGTCRECGQKVGLTARYSNKIRKHKIP